MKKADAAPKAAAKPRTAATRKKADIRQMVNPAKADVLQMDTLTSISHEQVAELAHRFWNERGRAHGSDAEDWFRAEQLLRGKAS
jgi:hypothetical protein